MSDFCLYFWKTVLLDLSFLIVHLLKNLALWICHPTASLIVSREKSAINLFGIPLYMMNPFSYCFQDFLYLSVLQLWSVWLWISLPVSSLEYVELLCIDYCFSSKFGNFQLLLNIFSTSFSFLSFCIHILYMLVLLMMSHISLSHC